MVIYSDEGLEKLIVGIVEQAVIDYRQAQAVGINSFKAYKAKMKYHEALKEEQEIRAQYGCRSDEHKQIHEKVIRCHNRYKKYELAEYRIAECEAFFRSGWFTELVNVDPEWLINTIKNSVH